MGFEESRENEGQSSNVGFYGDWQTNIYRHPERQGEHPANRYSMIHDVYSLGVVLLELGLWQPLDKYKQQLHLKSPNQALEFLQTLAGRTAITMGERYRDIVLFCLGLGSNSNEITGVKYINEVLNGLEDMAMSLTP
jgi:hypothetical protein